MRSARDRARNSIHGDAAASSDDINMRLSDETTNKLIVFWSEWSQSGDELSSKCDAATIILQLTVASGNITLPIHTLPAHFPLDISPLGHLPLRTIHPTE